MTETEAHAVFLAADYSLSNETSKVREYIASTGRIAYLRLGQGFPTHADVVLDPRVDPSALLAIAGVELNPRVEFRFGSNMKTFPRQINRGVEPEHYGRALQATSAGALRELCDAYAVLP